MSLLKSFIESFAAAQKKMVKTYEEIQQNLNAFELGFFTLSKTEAQELSACIESETGEDDNEYYEMAFNTILLAAAKYNGELNVYDFLILQDGLIRMIGQPEAEYEETVLHSCK